VSDAPSAWQGDLDRADLVESTAPADPLALFATWYDDAQHCGLAESTAMTLATVDADGRPSARIVLLKGFDTRGFRFYTNYESAKGQALAAHPEAALVFWWEPLERQVRIQGHVSKLPGDESDAYFARRSRGSRLGAHASPQSRPLDGRDELANRVADTEARFADADVPRPSHWGGYVVTPRAIEFWQARRSRLHDRLRYIKADGDWQIERLSP